MMILGITRMHPPCMHVKEYEITKNDCILEKSNLKSADTTICFLPHPHISHMDPSCLPIQVISNT
jgi:hypothetical protein